MQPRALAGKQHTVLGFGRAMYFGWHRELEKLSGSQCVEMATGGAEPLAREREAGASGNLLGAGAEAQADSCEVVLGRGRRDRTLWRWLSPTAQRWVTVLPCSLSNPFSRWKVPSREGRCMGHCPTTDARRADSECPCISPRVKCIGVDSASSRCHRYAMG